MPSIDSTRCLNRLMNVLTRSFPQYIVYTRPYISAGEDLALETLEQIARDQTSMSDRISALIQQSEESIDAGEFLTEFTGMHDLSLDYLVDQAILYQRKDIETIRSCIDGLRRAPAARALAEETLGMATGHLESLEELVNRRKLNKIG